MFFFSQKSYNIGVGSSDFIDQENEVQRSNVTQQKSPSSLSGMCWERCSLKKFRETGKDEN